MQRARRREVFSSDDLLATKSLIVLYVCVCQSSGTSGWAVLVCGRRKDSIALPACDNTALRSFAVDSPRIEREVLLMACKKLNDATVAVDPGDIVADKGC